MVCLTLKVHYETELLTHKKLCDLQSRYSKHFNASNKWLATKRQQKASKRDSKKKLGIQNKNQLETDGEEKLEHRGDNAHVLFAYFIYQ